MEPTPVQIPVPAPKPKVIRVKKLKPKVFKQQTPVKPPAIAIPTVKVAAVSPVSVPSIPAQKVNNHFLANKMALGLAVATGKRDRKVTVHRYYIHNAIRQLRRQKPAGDVSMSGISRRSGLSVSILKKVLKYGGYKTL
jgi:hypothetical protein